MHQPKAQALPEFKQ